MSDEYFVSGNCINESDLAEIGSKMVEDFERKVASIPAELCAPFHAEAKNLEAQILMIYQMVAKLAKREEDLDRVAVMWRTVVEMCDACLFHLKVLHQDHPYCGADSYYDKVLDLRNKCRRMQEMHS